MSNGSKYCAKCKSVVFPSKALNCSNKIWSGACKDCETCDISLNSDASQSKDGEILYCPTHYTGKNSTPIIKTHSSLNKDKKPTPVTTAETGKNLSQKPVLMNIQPATKTAAESNSLITNPRTQNVEEFIGDNTPKTWSIERVSQWLSSIGLAELIKTFRENEIDGSLLMSDGFDDATLKELIPKMPFRIRLKDERIKLRSQKPESTMPTTEKLTKTSETVLLSSEDKNESLSVDDEANSDIQNPSPFPAARIGAKAVCLTSIQSQSSNHNQIDLQYLLTDDNCIHSVQIDAVYFNTDDYEFLKKVSLSLCSYEYATKSTELDRIFNTLIDETISAKNLIEELIENNSLKAYVVDSLKRYNSLMDIIHILSSCTTLQSKDFQQKDEKIIENLFDITDGITKSVLLTTTIDSLSYESQRYFGNFIRKNDLPIPFTYYTWNKQKNFLEYKINFNTLAETMCLTNGQYVLHMGSPSTIGMGKTSLLQFIFPDKRLETLTTDGSSTLRNGCIDVLFSSYTNDQKNESYIIFDVHGTMNAFNEDTITTIQHYCSFQIFYVTQEDLNTAFLKSMMNYSKFTQEKPTIVIIFDPKYDDKHNQAVTVIDPFKLKYNNWKCLKWLTAPPETLWNQPNSNKKNKDLNRSQRLIESFRGMTENINEETKKQIHCTSIFSIQNSYLSLSKSNDFSRPMNYNFEIQNRLNELFGELKDGTENLIEITPVTYFDSEIKKCERELAENWDAPQKEIQVKKDNLIQQRSKLTVINSYTKFFINLLTKRSYIELLITEKYLEKWRSKFEPTLLEQLRKTKNEALQYSSQIKQLEERLAVGNNINEAEKNKMQQELNNVKSKYKKQHSLISNINEKLMNIDLTIGLFCDEIMALYEHCPHLFQSKTFIDDIGKVLMNLMLKGFAIHILRGRPLRCHSKLIEESIKFIQSTERPPLVLTVIGEQSSAKSSLMNTTFGCNFRVSSGRCTIGMYMSVIHWKSETIVIFDTEGLLSLEEAGSIFDNQMVTMAVLSSNLVLINHKGEFSSELKNFIGMSFYAKLNIRSPIKPKFLFVLRDQADLTSNKIFFHQLTQLKEQLQNDSQYLKTSIDDELDIHHESVYLLPNAFSHDLNPVSGTKQRWRNQVFPNEIMQLRHIIFENITNTTKTSKFPWMESILTTASKTENGSHPETPSIEPAYTDMTHLYGKISSNWDAIDRLGPKLLQCKTLYELSIMEELQTKAYDIIKEINVTVYQNGEKLISEKLLPFSKTNFINMNRDSIVEEFNYQLNIHVMDAVSKAQTSFDSQTDRSCYIPEIKSKVRRSIEPPIRSVQQLLTNNFLENLNNILKKYRLNDTQKQLLDSIQKEFDQNKSLKPEDLKNLVETSFENTMKQYRNDLESSHVTEAMIREKILTFYNQKLYGRQAETSKESVYNLLSPISDMAQHKKYFEKFEYCLTQIGKQQISQGVVGSKGLLKAIKSFFTGPSKLIIDSLWTNLKSKLGWFTNNKKESKNKKLFTDIWNVIQQQFEDLLQLTIQSKSVSSNPKIIESLFQHIENVMNCMCVKQYDKSLEKHALCFDLAVIGLNIIMDQATKIEQSNYESNLQSSTNEMTECKNNILDQCTAMNNAFESGKALAKTIGTEIMNEISSLLQRRIEKEIKEDIVKNQFINHEQIQKQAYHESFTDGNGENIIKYVYNINRYFLELSLREIKPTLLAVIHKHTLNFQDLFIAVINKANDCVQQRTYTNTGDLRDDVRKEILQLSELNLKKSADTELFKMFSLSNIICMPITQVNEFKQGFKSISKFYEEIKKRVDDLTNQMKNKAFESCKQSIAQKLGCQVICPCCGAKCSKPEPHVEENVEVWQDPCKKCPEDKCTCERPQPKSIITHETTYHVAGAFHGWAYHNANTPILELCYQQWKTGNIWLPTNYSSNGYNRENVDDGEWVFPRAKFFNEYFPAWYNGWDQQSIEGNACKESIPPDDQRRAWMIVRPTLLNRYRYSMVDHNTYDEKLYPHNVNTLSADFDPKWNDETFE